MSSPITHCPVCGFGPLETPYESVEELRSSYDICPCCGCEYGYDDHEWHFETWVAQGCSWFHPERRPEGWQLESQLSDRIIPWPPVNPGMIVSTGQ